MFVERLDAACDELARTAPGVLALQEVRPSIPGHAGNTPVTDCISSLTSLPSLITSPSAAGGTDGPALLSAFPLTSISLPRDTPKVLLGYAVRAFLTVDRVKLAITNVHLDWRSIASRERQIVAVIDWIDATGELDRHEVLLGDFNCTPESSVYRFLMGQQTLATTASTPWHDLPRLHAVRNGREPGTTLDFEHNPRWIDHPTLDIPARVDWLLIQNCFTVGRAYPRLLHADRFGVSPSGPDTVVPSDHYGVFADLEFPV